MLQLQLLRGRRLHSQLLLLLTRQPLLVHALVRRRWLLHRCLQGNFVLLRLLNLQLKVLLLQFLNWWLKVLLCLWLWLWLRVPKWPGHLLLL